MNAGARPISLPLTPATKAAADDGQQPATLPRGSRNQRAEPSFPNGRKILPNRFLLKGMAGSGIAKTEDPTILHHDSPAACVQTGRGCDVHLGRDERAVLHVHRSGSRWCDAAEREASRLTNIVSMWRARRTSATTDGSARVRQAQSSVTPSITVFGDRDPLCLAWTDNCHAVGVTKRMQYTAQMSQ